MGEASAAGPAVARRTRRRLVATALTVGAGAGALPLVTACGGAPDGGGQPGAAAPSAAPVTFQYWDWAPVWKDLVGQLVDGHTARAAAQHRPVTIDWQIATDYWTKLQVAIAGDTAPDSWRMNGPNLPSWSSQGLIQDVTAYASKDKDVTASLKAMSPVIAEYTRRGGKQWSMPFGQAISGILAYNLDQVKAEGLTPPAELWASGKWTWALLQEYAIKLTRRDGERAGYYVDRGSEVGWLPYVFGNGGALFDAPGKKATASTPQVREALEWLSGLAVKQRVTPTVEDLAQESADKRFLNGRLTMLPQGSWQIKDLNQNARGFAWDLVPVPVSPRTGKNGSTNQMASVAMSRSSKQKDAVWEWMRFVGAKEGQDLVARAEYYPARTDSAEQLYYRPELGPAHRSQLRDVLQVTQPLPWLDIAGNTAGWGPIVDPLIKQMLEGTLTVQDGVQQMQEQLTSGIERGFK
jgi:multiple sugar transport system substrate-binding protein